MTLASTILQKLDSWRPKSPRDAVTVEAAEAKATLAVDRLETLGCQLWELRLEAAPVADLQGWAGQVAGRVTGLLEPLKLIEADAGRGLAVLRSSAPARRDDDLFYYEVLLEKTGAATVRRYHNTRQPARRDQVSFVLTREALGKLTDDLLPRP
jgi:hypothetical protein